jgi:hypothetical protein
MARTLVELLGAAVMVVTTAGAVGAQSSDGAKVSGVKLVDMKARTPEQSVTLVFDRDSLRIVEPNGASTLKRFAYTDLSVTHTVSSAPPESAGNPSAVGTGSASMPMYMGKTPRNWLTLSSAGEQVTLRVSAKVYDQVKAELTQRQVAVAEGR